jgi:hypothetical protein
MLIALPQCSMQRTTLESSAAETHGGAEGELDFWDDLQTRRVVTNHDALHGLLLLADGTDERAGYEDRLAEARRRGWVDEDDAPPANESAAMGMLAVAACDMLDVRGGVTMRIFGRSPRYCTRELVYMEIIPPRTEQQALSGLQFIDFVSRLEARMSRRPMEPSFPDDPV